MFTRILIANRGEIAVRLIHACHGLGIEAVAVYSEADANALFVQLADDAIPIGAAPASESYLQMDKLISAAQQTACQAIHPGYGFLSENATFADRVRQAGLVLIAPPTDAIHLMGSKTEARQLMQAAGVPVVPGYQGAAGDFVAEAARTGYPILVKAAAGGGGKGMRVVQHPDDLPDAIETAQREAQNAFGDATLFLEKYIPHAHHIEFQILGDEHGNIVHLFERECSIQRRHQKIIEETPSPLLDDSLRQQMGAAAVAAAQAVNYTNAGTVEFIVDEQGNFYFLEMNTRLQVEHPITEATTTIDLAQWQIRIATGEALPFRQADLTQQGHAIECRVYAEDPANDFLPSVGDVLVAQFPTMPGVRVDTGIQSGDTISIYYDPMIAKIIAHGATRHEAIQRMQHALRETILLGVTHNIPFLQAVLAHPAFLAGDTPTHFIPQHLADWQPDPPSDDTLQTALIAAAIQEWLSVAKPTASKGDNTRQGDAHSPWHIADGFRMGG